MRLVLVWIFERIVCCAEKGSQESNSGLSGLRMDRVFTVLVNIF
ncbi:hypothetical protein SynROS8604_03053 [Synechococcus sp. ROS8604]|nr:hypothetical protein SynROS8604_03053 [Synechococcus sp. ROS8604]